MNKDHAAVAIDLASSITDAHTNRDEFAGACKIGAPVGLSANPAGTATIDAAEGI
jgi:hypothetical protein